MSTYSHTILLYNKYRHWLKNEALEQANLVLWLEKNNYTYTAIPNSTYTKSFKQKMMNTLTGVKPWLCDMLIVLKNWWLLFIELKRLKKVLKSWKLSTSNSSISENQQEWIDALNNINNIQAEICYGCDESIEIIKRIEIV